MYWYPRFCAFLTLFCKRIAVRITTMFRFSILTLVWERNSWEGVEQKFYSLYTILLQGDSGISLVFVPSLVRSFKKFIKIEILEEIYSHKCSSIKSSATCKWKDYRIKLQKMTENTQNLETFKIVDQFLGEKKIKLLQHLQMFRFCNIILKWKIFDKKWT